MAALTCAMAAACVTMGLTWPLLSLLLEAQGVGTTLIGLSAAVQSLAILGVAPATPRLVARLGSVRAVALSMAVTLAALLLLPAFPSVYAWFPLRFLLGAGTTVMFIVTDTWINEITEESVRGRVMGIYNTALAAGWGAGPLIILVTGIHGWAPFVTAAAITAVAMATLRLVRGLAPTLEGRPAGGLSHFLRSAPTVMLAALMFALIDAVLMSFLALYGLRSGLGQSASVAMLTVLVVGSVLFQVPIGVMADRFNRHLMLIACTLVNLLCTLLLPVVIGDTASMWAVMIVWGGAIGGFWTVGLTLLGERFRGVDLVAANTAFTVLYGIGSVAGPFVTGAAMHLWNPHGMVLVLVAASLVYLPVAVARHLRRRRAAPPL